jgi:hypothetical protein
VKLKSIYFPFLERTFEPKMRDVCDVAFRSAEHLITEAPERISRKTDSERWKVFVELVHRGFASAQATVAAELRSLESGNSPLQQQKELALRKVVDGIAWQMIGNQLYIARRLYRGQEPPNLHHSNFTSVQMAADHVQGTDFSRFALISDLTTFVQVGDLLIKEPSGVFSIAEVKEGKKNEEILNFMHFAMDAKCEQALALFYQREGKKTFEQMLRMMRQSLRMAHVSELVANDESTDPDSQLTIRVNKEPLQIDTYSERLSGLIDSALSKGWAIDIVDDCLFMGAYSGKMISAAPFVFRAWVQGVGVAEWNPIVNLLESMIHPLALPLFNRGVRVEHTFDLLFGRAAVFLCVDFQRFMEKAADLGVSIRWSTRKEAAQMKGDFGALRVDNRVPIAEANGVSVALGDGVTTRIVLHEQTPVSAISALLTTLAEGSATRHAAAEPEPAG